MLYVFYGSYAILMWKCGAQRLMEVKHKSTMKGRKV